MGEQVESRYTRQQLCLSERFVNERDILNALLQVDVEYTLAEVEKVVGEFKGKAIIEKVNGGK